MVSSGMVQLVAKLCCVDSSPRLGELSCGIHRHSRLAGEGEAGVVVKGSFGCVTKATVQVHGHGSLVVAVKRAVRK
jgi:hypothetical protein